MSHEAQVRHPGVIDVMLLQVLLIQELGSEKFDPCGKPGPLWNISIGCFQASGVYRGRQPTKDSLALGIPSLGYTN